MQELLKMANKVELNNLESISANDAAAVLLINNNFEAIQEEFNNTLSRDGTVPNYMDAELDMNSRRIINTAAPVGDFDVVNKKYFDDNVGNAQEYAAAAAESAAQAEQSKQDAASLAADAAEWYRAIKEVIEDEKLDILIEDIDTLDTVADNIDKLIVIANSISMFDDVWLLLKASNVSITEDAWVPDNTYARYPYAATVGITDVTSAYAPIVTFSEDDAASGNFAPVALAGDGTVTFYAKRIPATTITIPTILFQ